MLSQLLLEGTPNSGSIAAVLAEFQEGSAFSSENTGCHINWLPLRDRGERSREVANGIKSPLVIVLLTFERVRFANEGP